MRGWKRPWISPPRQRIAAARQSVVGLRTGLHRLLSIVRHFDRSELLEFGELQIREVEGLPQALDRHRVVGDRLVGNAQSRRQRDGSKPGNSGVVLHAFEPNRRRDRQADHVAERTHVVVGEKSEKIDALLVEERLGVDDVVNIAQLRQKVRFDLVGEADQQAGLRTISKRDLYELPRDEARRDFFRDAVGERAHDGDVERDESVWRTGAGHAITTGM